MRHWRTSVRQHVSKWEAGKYGEREEVSMLTFVQMRTVVICFNTPFRVRSVGMEGVEMGAYGFEGAEALGGRELSVGKPSQEP